MSIVSRSQKADELESIIRAAATRHVSHGINIAQEHKLASRYDAVSRRDRHKVMVPSGANRELYCEIIPAGSVTNQEDSRGKALIVTHTFEAWLVYGWEDGVTQSTWNDMVEGIDPAGILHELRQTGAYGTTDVDGNTAKVLFGQPDMDEDITPLGQDGGKIDTAHVLQGTISIRDWQ